MPGWTWPNGSLSIPNVSDEYGMRTHPIYGTQTMHWGIDLTGFNYVLAAADGEVIFAAYYGGAGNYVQVRHPGGTVTGYKHLARIDVSVGQQVKRGQNLGPMGTTGDSTGIHLHFECQLTSSNSPMDPRVFMAARIAEGGGVIPAGGGIPGSSTPSTPPARGPPEEDDDMRLFFLKFSDGNLAWAVSTSTVDFIIPANEAAHLTKALGVEAIELNEQDWDVWTRARGQERAALKALVGGGGAAVDIDEAQLAKDLATELVKVFPGVSDAELEAAKQAIIKAIPTSFVAKV